MNFHVLPGDAQVENFRKTGIEGEVVVCREAFIDGDVRANSVEELWQVRERYLSNAYPEVPAEYRTGVVAEFEKLLDLSSRDEVNLWFEYELFCQVNLWFCVWLLRESRADLYRVAPIMQRKDRTWNGFGGLSPEQLELCFDGRLKFSPRDIQLGSDLWIAYQNRDYAVLEKLSHVESPCFPYLREVCEAEIEKDYRPKEVLRDLKQSGLDDFGQLFASFKERAGVYGFGDSQVRRLLSDI